MNKVTEMNTDTDIDMQLDFDRANDLLMRGLAKPVSEEDTLIRIFGLVAQDVKELMEACKIAHHAQLLSFPDGSVTPKDSVPAGISIPDAIPCKKEVIHVTNVLLSLGAQKESFNIIPSAIVAKRLLRNHPRLAEPFPNGVPTAIVKAIFPDGHGVELFIVNALSAQESLDELVKETERHTAFTLRNSAISHDELVGHVQALSGLFQSKGFRTETGGINTVEGTTTLYFRKDEPFRRVEIILSGIYDDILASHNAKGDTTL